MNDMNFVQSNIIYKVTSIGSYHFKIKATTKSFVIFPNLCIRQSVRAPNLSLNMFGCMELLPQKIGVGVLKYNPETCALI